SISNALGQSSVAFSDSAVGQALTMLRDKGGPAVNFVQSQFQMALAADLDAVNSAYKWVSGVDLFQADPRIVEVEFVSGLNTKIQFQTTEQPISIRVYRKNNAAPNQSWTWWSVRAPSGTKLELNFTGGNVGDLTDLGGVVY